MTRILAAITIALAILAPLSGALVVSTGLLILWLTIAALAADATPRPNLNRSPVRLVLDDLLTILRQDLTNPYRKEANHG